MSASPKKAKLSCTQTRKPSAVGPLVNDGAPYSALRKVERCLLANLLQFECLYFELKQRALTGYDHWQYGQGEH